MYHRPSRICPDCARRSTSSRRWSGGGQGAEADEAVDWRRPRMVRIAAGISHHDRVAVQRLPEGIDLVHYRIFEGAC